MAIQLNLKDLHHNWHEIIVSSFVVCFLVGKKIQKQPFTDALWRNSIQKNFAKLTEKHQCQSLFY